MRSSRKWPPEMWQWTCSDIRPRTFFHSATTSSRCSRLYHPCSCARLMVWETASVRLAVTSLCVSVYVRGSTGGCFPWPCCLPLSSSTPRNSTFSFDASKIAGPNSLAVYTYTRNRTSPGDSSAQRRPKTKLNFLSRGSIGGIEGITTYRHDVSPPPRVPGPPPEHDHGAVLLLLLQLGDREQGHGRGRSGRRHVCSIALALFTGAPESSRRIGTNKKSCLLCAESGSSSPGEEGILHASLPGPGG
jgi:hypothetical protein